MQSNMITFLKNMAHQLRIHSIQMTSAAGSGHPTSCMSAAEIMSVLFFHQMKYDPKRLNSLQNDGFVLSKGHAAPILYAAYAEAGSIPVSDLQNLRSFDSPLEGHPVPRLEGVRAATGSLGQGLSIGAGMALAQQSPGQGSAGSSTKSAGRHTYVLLGDGEMAEGNVWEAMNFASYYNLSNLTAILDMNRLGQSEATMFQWNTEEYELRAKSFGWHVITVDGHSVEDLLQALDKADKHERPSFIIARTVKGKYGGSAENNDGYHGKPLPDDELSEIIDNLKGMISPVDYQPSNFIEAEEYKPDYQEIRVDTEYTIGEKEATRTAFGKALVKIGKQDPNTVVLDGDVKGSSRTKFFFGEYPDRSYEAYIAEQNMIGLMVGLQAYGKRVAAASFAAFLTRAHDQIRMAAYSDARLLLSGSHTGVSIGADGPSQMGLEDIAMMRSVYGSAVLSPSDAVSAEKLTAAAANYDGIAYVRTIRGKTMIIYDNNDEFRLGGSKVLKESQQDHATFVASGYTVTEALAAAEELEDELGVSIRVIDCYSLKPVDTDTLQKAASETKVLITAEDHYPEGGLGEIVAAAVSGHAMVYPLSVTRRPHSGETEKLLAEQGIDKDGIKQKFKELFTQEEA